VELDRGIEVRRPPAVRMHLRVETVERANRVATREQPVCQMRPDEAGATRDQDVQSAG
jgi:hypothetical protein